LNVPFVDLRAQHQSLKTDIDAVLQRILDSSQFILGPDLEEFERALATYVGVGHAVGVGSGTAALTLALQAAGIGAGDEVITPVNTYIATCEAIVRAGATPRWVDANPHTHNIDVSQIEGAITSRTKAIVPVHLYGQPADMTAVMQIAQRHGLNVIEDCAQSIGARWQGQQTGTFGHAGCFSFFPAKNLGACGDAGGVVTNDAELAARVRMLRNHGQRERNVHVIDGGCDRMDNLQAAILRVKLPHVDDWNARRRAAARRYIELLADVPGVVLPATATDAEPVYHLFVVQVPDRDRTQQQLGERGIQTGIHYPTPVHEQPVYAHFGYKAEDFPIASRLGRRILSLPMFPELRHEQIEYVADALKEIVTATAVTGIAG